MILKTRAIKYSLALGSLILVLALSGCSTLKRITHPAAHPGTSVMGNILTPYSGPKASMAVADFEMKAAKATGEIGVGLREILVAALAGSKRFSVIERQASTAVSPGADLIITAAVTDFEPLASGGKSGAGGGGGVGNGVLGALLSGALNKAYITLDVRIVDAASSKVLAATRLEGRASDAIGAIMEEALGNWSSGSGLSAYANTPMEKAIRICLVETARYIIQAIPPGYYK